MEELAAKLIDANAHLNQAARLVCIYNMNLTVQPHASSNQ